MNIEDLEKISVEELESIAAASGSKMPFGTHRRLRNAVREAAAKDGALPVRRHVRWPLYAVAATVACAIVAVAVPSGPKDTFSSPELAYAELEKAINTISSKVQEPVNNIMDKINE